VQLREGFVGGANTVKDLRLEALSNDPGRVSGGGECLETAAEQRYRRCPLSDKTIAGYLQRRWLKPSSSRESAATPMGTND